MGSFVFGLLCVPGWFVVCRPQPTIHVPVHLLYFPFALLRYCNTLLGSARAAGAGILLGNLSRWSDCSRSIGQLVYLGMYSYSLIQTHMDIHCHLRRPNYQFLPL